MFGQQRDERKAWVPKYDRCFFEVQTRPSVTLIAGPSAGLRAGSGVVKMLHEMQAP
jgi:hypothetical protein